MIETVKRNYKIMHTEMSNKLKSGELSESDFTLQHNDLTRSLDLWYLNNGYKGAIVYYKKDDNGVVIDEIVDETVAEQISKIESKITNIVDLEVG